jgi:hypothetical protein
MSDACWSPAMPAIGGEPGSARASPTMPVESTTDGSMAGGIRSASSTSLAQSLPSPVRKPVTAALDASVTWRRPSDNTHATHVSTVPKTRSRSRL